MRIERRNLMALFTKKTWKNRMSEYPTRRRLTKENGTTELVTVARSEGTVSQEGDAFSADNMNNLEDRILRAIGTGDIPKELGADIVSAINALNTGLKTKIVSKDTYVTEITVPGKGIVLKSLIVSNGIGYSVRSISLYCNDNYIVPHLINWDRNVDSNGNTTSYVINVALHNLYDGSRTAGRCGAITIHTN